MTPFNIYPIINIIESFDLKVKFIDINLYDFGPNYSDLDHHLSRRPSFFLLTYLFGYVPNLNLILDKCRKYGVPLIEDFSQAIGATYNDRLLGTFGYASFYSASLTKYVDGYNGAFILKKNFDKDYKIKNYLNSFENPNKKRLKSIIFKTFIWNFALNRVFFNIITYPILYFLRIINRNYFNKILGAQISFNKDPILPKYYFESISEIQAQAIGKFLKALPELISQRRKCFARFEKAYKEVTYNVKPKRNFQISKLNNYKGNVYWQLVLKVINTKVSQEILFSWGVETGITNLPNLAKEYNVNLPNSESLKENYIFIPLHNYLTINDYKKLILKLVQIKQI
jgi:dTDP-4-amino-4,6-dideoxygalactose transaminase